MRFNDEDIKTLSAWEENFRTAVKAKWARNPGRSGLRVIWETYTRVTGDRRRLNDSCSSCILSLLTDCGKLYFASIEERGMANSSGKEVKVAQMAGNAPKRARIKTTKKCSTT